MVVHLLGVAVEIATGQVTVYDYGEPIVGTDKRTCGTPARFAVSHASQSVIVLPSAWTVAGLDREWSIGRQGPESLKNCVVFDRLDWACQGPAQTGGWIRMNAGQLGAFVEPPINPPEGFKGPSWNRVSAYRISMSWLRYRITCGYGYELSLMRRRGLGYHLGWW